MVFVIVMVVAVGFVFTAAPVAAKSKKMNLIKDKNITYYKSGLVKSVSYYDTFFVKFKYDSKGKITVIKVYEGPYEPVGLEAVYKFKYSKSKLKSIVRIFYQDGEAVSKENCELKVGKKNTIQKIKYYDQYSEADLILQCAYDSKGRVKKNIFKAYYYEKVDTYAKRVIKRSSKGYLKKVTGNEVWGKDKMKYINKYITKIKKGKVTNITMKGKKNYAEFYKYKYKKMKVDKKLVKIVKAQQLDALYLQAATVTTSPQFALIEIF